MASFEDHTSTEEQQYEDQEAQELFESFMNITKDVEILQDKSNEAVAETKDETTMKEDILNINDTPIETESGDTKELSNLHQGNSLTTEECDCNTLIGPTEDDSNISKRLSKAVDDLSDLEKQLSLMMSSGGDGNSNSAVNPTVSEEHNDKDVSDNSNEAQESASEKVANWGDTDGDASNSNSHSSGGGVDPNSAVNPTASEEHTDTDVSDNSNETQGSACEKVANWGDTDGDASNSSKSQSDTVTTSMAKAPQTSTNPTDRDDTNVEVAPNADGTDKQNNEDMSKEDPKTCQLNTNDTEILPDIKDEQKPTLSDVENNEKEASQVEAESVEGNEGSSLLSSTENESEELQEQNNDTELEQADLSKLTSEDNTINTNPSTDDSQGTSDQEDGPSLANSQAESSQDSSTTEVVDNDGTDSSAPEIEILMTDESGISELKSLDSLDVDLNDLRPDSPALSDEGIDSDAKSLDDIDDENAFHNGSIPDLTSVHKAKLLGVDRNRMGSNSSTLSEIEFRTSMSHKSDTEDVESGKVHMKGYLLKLGGSGFTPRNWRKRWFALKEDNCLYYYKNPKDKVPCGVIVLCNYLVTKAPDSSKKYCFKIDKGGARTYHLCAANDDDMRNWMVALMQAAVAVPDSGTSFQILEGNVHNVSIPALAIKHPECHGYLSKKGQNIKSWKRRYCVLKNGYLYYYLDMSNTTALGVAKLIGYQIQTGEIRGKHFCFCGNPPDESMRVFHFSAETENDRERWMKRMKESIRKGTISAE